VEISFTSPPEAGESILNVGDKGEVVTRLRPAGTAKFGKAIVDVVSSGEYIEKGDKIEIIDLRGNRVVVRGIRNG
jgi:membrane-bound serine protease (ClpP class)